ncbi:helix-turn-helix domain-containing protein [Chryseobacterium cucumeris]|uniref:winged helix-turn-helix transcriptional regulator n=1 Tax=Chryseobacterium TaxID=59732 RepID=UPI0028833C34|nr:helix-turn-helix domain-containing protein [Chryseobacterium sp. SG20098]WNI35954.1 helix-turn-helix domain-containing protein [Chryseobacterium sp. SG20098]WNI36548.1 helix-turn-helix domain-containing protein [Chryseobacterium sp. SG20098]
METKKENSTNNVNLNYLNNYCGISYTLVMIGGRWKINILAYLLKEKKLRFGEFKNKLEGISERMLIKRLKELENDGLISKIIYPQYPRKVEYELTILGQSLKEIIKCMDEWGESRYDKT